MNLTLQAVVKNYAVCKLQRDQEVPTWATKGDLYAITKTSDELSIVCEEKYVPEGIKAERNWQVLKIQGPLDFGLVGVLSSLLSPLAAAGISIFAISTYETDYILINGEKFKAACKILEDLGNKIS